MSFWGDMRVLYRMAVAPVRGNTHSERLESFYGKQAQDYDDFRRRLLQGREALMQELDVPEGSVWVDMGAGTGANAEFFGDTIEKFSKVHLVDLSPSLLKMADERIEARGWENVETVEADATAYMPESGPVDLVTFSYSLTMIPDWYRAIDHALKLLKPGGTIGVVDFYVARKHAEDVRHGWLTRMFWPVWFATDNVFLSRDHLPYLRSHFEEVTSTQERAKIPYFPVGRVPIYRFIGRKAME